MFFHFNYFNSGNTKMLLEKAEQIIEQERWTWWMSFRPWCIAQYFQMLRETVLICQHWVTDVYKFSPYNTSSGPTNVTIWCQLLPEWQFCIIFLYFLNSFLVFSGRAAWWNSHGTQPVVSGDLRGSWVEPVLMWKYFCKARTGVWKWRNDTENWSSFAHCSGETSGPGHRIN